MSATITPLYAQTRILLQLFGLEKENISKTHFLPDGKPYAKELEALVSQGALKCAPSPRNKNHHVY